MGADGVAARVRHMLRRRWTQLVVLSPLLARNLLSRATVTAPEAGPVVSLTTFGARTALVFLALESIGRGAQRPHRLLLWLDDPAVVERPPAALRRLVRRGLEILPTEDYGPHKKYYPYVREHADDGHALVTADDDVVYPRDWLAALEAAAAGGPGDVVCHRARVMEVADGHIAPYATWRLARTAEPSPRIVPTGVGGVRYPVAMQRALRDAGEAFLACAPRTDDIWLHATALRTGTPVRQVASEAREFPDIPTSQHRSSLMAGNVHGDGNDRAIEATYSAADVARLAAG